LGSLNIPIKDQHGKQCAHINKENLLCVGNIKLNLENIKAVITMMLKNKFYIESETRGIRGVISNNDVVEDTEEEEDTMIKFRKWDDTNEYKKNLDDCTIFFNSIMFNIYYYNNARWHRSNIRINSKLLY